MQKINTADGLFVDGNPSTGALGTVLTAAWLNMVQAELISVLTAAGITVDGAKSDQLVTAIKKFAWGTKTTLAGYGITDAMPAATQVIATGAALDALRTSGFYIVFGTNGDGEVLHIQHPNSTTYAVQLMFGQWGQVPSTSGIGLSYRALVSGAWTPWQKIWHAGNFDPQAQSVTAFTTAGAAPAFTLSPSPAIPGYVANQRFRVKFNAVGSTGSNTLNVSGNGAKNLKQYDSTGAKIPAVIAANQLADVEYDGTDFVVLDPLPMAPLPAGLPLDWIGLTPPSWAVVRDGSALSRASYASLFTAICPTRSGTLTSGQNTVTGLPTTLDMWVGMPVEGAGVPAGTTVGSITGTTSITLSANATASGAQTLTLFPFGYGSGGSAATFGVPDDRGLHTRAYDSGRGYEQSTLTANTTSASNVLSGISSTRGLYVGMPVSGAGIPASTTISSITGTSTATISNNATATATAVALTVTGRQIGAEGTDEVKSHNHAPLSPQTGFYGPGGSGTSIPTGSTSWSSQTSTANTGGPENNVKRRIYLPIITIGA